MKIIKLLTILDEIKRNRFIKDISNEIHLSYKHLECWYDNEKTLIDDEKHLTKLNKILTQEDFWKDKRGTLVFFSLKEYSAVVTVNYKTRPRKTTIVKSINEIKESVRIAIDSYFASHDELTGLLNLRGIDDRVNTIISNEHSTGLMVDKDSDKLQVLQSMSILLFDIDFFKQVNDTFGHDYGDIVLVCFSKRLEGIIDSLPKELSKNLNIELGRTGGEEFRALVYGELNEVKLQDIAEYMRIEISENELPNEKEWNSSLLEEKPQSLDLPHVSERKITVSIGISSIRPMYSVSSKPTILKELQREADTAMYKAKFGGRNRSIYFSKIREKYGSVLEHHKETNTVTIDLGSNVNISIGDEFLVYHPDFKGGEAFIYSDGRTQKKLGEYPRHPSGRVEVFNVQKEISFCNVSENKMGDVIPIGSLLSIVPIGTISHLLPADIAIPGQKGIITDITIIKSFNEIAIKEHKNILVTVFTIDNIKDIENTRGISTVNKYLANLYTSIREVFLSERSFVQIELDKFAAACHPPSKGDSEDKINNVIDAAYRKCDGIAQIGAGAFFQENQLSEPEEKNEEESKYEIKYSLEFARYATNQEVRLGNKIQFFDSSVASRVVYQQRVKGDYIAGIIDYKKLKGFGIEYAYLENQAALCALETKEIDLGLKCIKTAIQMDSYPVFIANRALLEAAGGEWEQAALQFDKLPEDYELSKPYIFPKAWAEYIKYKNKSETIDLEKTTEMIIKRKDDKEDYNITEEEINEAITTLRVSSL